MAADRRIAIGSFGGLPARILEMDSRQNWRRIRPIVWLLVVSGMRDRETFRARRAR